jgi:hypothetical protein
MERGLFSSKGFSEKQKGFLKNMKIFYVKALLEISRQKLAYENVTRKNLRKKV